jgi:hypothetical protein
VPLATIASEAMIEFLLHDPVINRGVDRSSPWADRRRLARLPEPPVAATVSFVDTCRRPPA